MTGSANGQPVIICGLGHVGLRVLGLLLRLGGRGCVIARGIRDDCREMAAPAFTCLEGDARDDRLLREAGVEQAGAVIIVTDDDLANVSIALDARRLNPRAALVVRLFDQELASHLERSAQITRALSSSALAAPAFVAAAMGGHVRGAFEVGDEVGVIEDLPAGADTAVEGKAVVARVRDGRTAHGPAAGTIRPGDRVTCLRLGGGRKAVERPRRARAALAGLREWWREVPGAIRLALAALGVVVGFSVALFHFTMGLSPIDAFYFIITTITTVGYGDFSFQHASAGLKIYGAFLMLCGAALLATIFSIVADAIVGARFREVLARGCAQFRGHVIVAGLGSIGYRLVKELVRSGETVVAIEQREAGEFVRPARAEAAVVLGNARAAETLRRAGVAGAKALIAATDNDLVNLGAALAAKTARPECRVVVRIFDSDLAEKMQGSLGIDAAVSVSAAAAPTFVGCALCPDVLRGVVLDDGLALIFHRKADGAGGCRDESESILFVRRGGQARFAVAPPGYAPHAGDEVIGSRWHPFREGQAGA